MFEDFEKNPDVIAGDLPSDQELEFLRSKLGNLAPDFVKFVETFGSADIGEGFFHFYGQISDLDEHIQSMGLEAAGLNAWVFGDGDGDMGVIDKTTGEFYQISHESLAPFSNRYNSFREFLTEWILRE